MSVGAALPAVGAEAAFVDDAGRRVDVPTPARRVLPAGPPADLLIHALAPDRLVGLVKPWSEEQRAVVAPMSRDLAIVPRLTPDPLKSDLGAIRALAPDLVVDYGDVTPKYAALADRVTATIGAPAVLMTGGLAETPRVLRTLGPVLGAGEAGERLAALAEAVLAGLAPLSTLPEEARVPVYLGRGVDGLDAVAAGTQLDEAIRAAGGRTVVAAGGGFFRSMTPEAVVALAPRVVILEQPAAMAPDTPLRRALPADTIVLLDDHHGFHWVENPASVNRFVGAVWLARRLHPGRAAFEETDVADLARAFLHVVDP